MDARKYDKNMQAVATDAGEVVWHSPAEPPFRLQGFPWFAADRVFRRMPLKPPQPLPEAVDNLAWHTSGGQIHFRSTARRIVVKVKLRGRFEMNHMPHTGMSGCDLYIGPSGAKRYYHTARFEINALEYQVLLFEHKQAEIRDFTLNLPLYNGVEEILIGLEPGCTLEAPLPYDDDRPVVIYGTSITHGGCASRPGMCYPNILSRRFNVPFVNLGFSGSGRAEPEVAHALAAVPDPLMYVIDCEANCGDPGGYEARLPVLLDILRAAHPEVPILLLSRIPNITELQQPVTLKTRLDHLAFQKKLVAARRKAGDKNLHFKDGSKLLEPDGHEGTVDTTHPNDAGFYHMAENLEPVFRKIIEQAVRG